MLRNKTHSRAKSTASILPTYITVDRSGLHVFFAEIFFTELIEKINVKSSCDMGERLLVCAVQGIESGRFSDSEILFHFLFEDIKQTKNNTV